jgi:magnesium-transporting ATPase (P-type)
MPDPGFFSNVFCYFKFDLFSIGPSIAMLIFRLLTVRHIRQAESENKLNKTQSSVEQNRRKKIDRQLIRMMLVQCIVFSSTASTFSIVWLYGSIRSNFYMVDALQRAKDNLLGNIVGLVAVTGPCTSFYLFILSSPLFRREVMHLFSFSRRQGTSNTMKPSNMTRKKPIL